MDTEQSEIDALVASTEESSNNEIPMEAPPSEQPEQQSVQTQPSEYEIEYGGRKIKASIDKILNWAQRGYDAPNRIGELSSKLKDYEGKFKQYETLEKTYRPVDEWAKANPEKWNNLIQYWQQAQYGNVPQGTPSAEQAQMQAQLPPEVIQKLQQHDQFIEKVQQQEIVQRQKQADSSLDGEIQSIRSQYTNLDFDATDQNGNSLEYQILKHATDNGIPSFRAAFRDYCFDKLNQSSEHKGRESAARPMSQKTREGLTGKPQSPQGRSPQIDVRNRNYDQIHDLILQEYGIR